MDALKNAVDYGIIGLLLALSVWCVAVAGERWLFYRRVDLGGISFTANVGNRTDQASRRNRHGRRQCALHRPARNRAGHHAHVPYDGHIRHNGGEYDHDRTQSGVEGDSRRTACGDSLRRHE